MGEHSSHARAKRDHADQNRDNKFCRALFSDLSRARTQSAADNSTIIVQGHGLQVARNDEVGEMGHEKTEQNKVIPAAGKAQLGHPELRHADLVENQASLTFNFN